MPTQVVISNTLCKVVPAGGTLPEEFLKIVSYVDKQRTFQQRQVTGKYEPVIKSLFSRRNNSFPTGLLPLVQKKFPDWEYVDNRVAPEVEWYDPPEELHYKKGHQVDALEAMKKHCRGTIDGVTAMGKTFVIGGFASIFSQSLLVLCHRKEIFDQIYKRCAELTGEEIGVIASGKGMKLKRITVGMVATIAAHLPELSKYLKRVDAIIIDEAHHCGVGSQYYKVVQSCTNAYYRFGLTGTPFREGGDTIAIFAVTGPVIYSYHYSQALDDGVVVPIKTFITPIQTILKTPLLYDFKFVYEHGIVRNEKRNEAIVSIIKRLYEKEENVLILVWRKVHGRIISGMLGDLPHVYIHGESTNRDAEKERFESGENPILIASSIYDEGVDINRIQNIIVAAGYKAARLTAQRVGRGLRPDPDKEFCRIFDFLDLCHSTLTSHSKKRIAQYKKYKCEIKELII